MKAEASPTVLVGSICEPCDLPVFSTLGKSDPSFQDFITDANIDLLLVVCSSNHGCLVA
ncbi:MAG: hypothetical protein SVY53_11410 [Chloroflexota bacterium]|nr:hypothetical protein [Chloroflexota bacterium]